jgi:hypothetical protein
MFIDSERGIFARDCPNCTPICTPLCNTAVAALVPTFAALNHVHAAVVPPKETTPHMSNINPPIHHAVLQRPSPIFHLEKLFHASCQSMYDPVKGATRSANSPAVAAQLHRFFSAQFL